MDFGTTECGDKRMSWGEVVPESALTIAHVDADNRARLQAIDSRNSDREHWFRFDELERKECEALAKAVVELLPQIDKWLEENEKGPNISIFEP